MSLDQSYYRGFSAEQYAADEYFQSWVLNPDHATDSSWESYLNLNPAEEPQVKAARVLVLDITKSGLQRSSLTADEKADIRSSIFETLGLDEYQEEKRVSYRRPILYAAASLLAIIAVSAFLLTDQPSPGTAVEKMLVQTTGAEETRKIFLPDSSLVILNAGSSIKYKENFNAPEQREVFLEGNAFFIVRKLEDRKKFIVHSKSVAVTVLGTEFNVNSRNEAVEVGLISGKVKVDEASTNKSELMLPGDQVTFDSANSRLIKSSIDISLYSAWLNNTWSFKQTRMDQVIALLEKYYGVKAEFRNPTMKNKRITASIPVHDLDMMAMILSKTVHSKVRHLNHRLIIQ